MLAHHRQIQSLTSLVNQDITPLMEMQTVIHVLLVATARVQCWLKFLLARMVPTLKLQQHLAHLVQLAGSVHLLMDTEMQNVSW